jgi:hypothetical protein
MSTFLEEFVGLLPSGRVRVPNGYYVYTLELQHYGIAYVGKGVGTRAWDHVDSITKIVKARLDGKPSKRETPVYNSIIRLMLKYKWRLKVRVVEEGLTEQAAFVMEQLLIEKYGRAISNDGKLLNLADGGVSIGDGYFEARKAYKNGTKTSKHRRPGKRERSHANDAFGTYGSKLN